MENQSSNNLDKANSKIQRMLSRINSIGKSSLNREQSSNIN